MRDVFVRVDIMSHFSMKEEGPTGVDATSSAPSTSSGQVTYLSTKGEYDQYKYFFTVNEMETFGAAGPCLDLLAPGRDAFGTSGPDPPLVLHLKSPRSPFQVTWVKKLAGALSKMLSVGTVVEEFLK
jgi:hypothetical protein